MERRIKTLIKRIRASIKDLRHISVKTVIHGCDLLLGHYDMITLTEGGNGIINKMALAL